MSESPIAAIIPAYNEAGHIERVLEALRDVHCLDEILVIDDGSTDDTAEVVRRAAEADARLRLLQHEKNLGKGQAIFTACAATQAKYLLLLDADLQGLTPAHVEALIRPVIEGRTDMTLGLFRGGRFNTDFSHWLTPWLTGQRCLRAEMLDSLNREAAAGYGFETALTVAAAQCGYHTRAVPLRGVWHPPSELHRKHGLGWRLNMYAQILRAWKMSGGWKAWWRHFRKRVLPMAFLLIFVLFALAQYRGYAASSPLQTLAQLNDLPPLALTDVQQIMVFAPHPDDETLAAGGAIQIARQQGAKVKVVVVTNGDGQVFAPAVLEKRPRPTPQDYIRLGQRRQAESLAALQLLGLSEQDVVFLGYPDRGLLPMWLADWQQQCPFTAPYTKVSADPYAETYNPHAEYCGRNLLADLRQLLEQDRPDLILLPHPADQHPDHRALSAYVRLAVALEEHDHPAYQPRLWGYLVHYASFPQPRGHFPEQALLPPDRLKTREPWGRLDISPEQTALKAQAIQKYPSQVLLLGKFLPSFARRNELFTQVILPLLAGVDFQPLSLPAATIAEPGDPDQAAFTHLDDLPVRGNAIQEWQIARLGDALALKVQTRREILPGRRLLLLVKTPDGRTQTLTLQPDGWLLGPTAHFGQFDLAAWGHPAVIALSVEIREGRFTISESGWQVLPLENGVHP
ncbi:MAG: PIG-L family deacetylase [Anaerolineae bacterium]